MLGAGMTESGKSTPASPEAFMHRSQLGGFIIDCKAGDIEAEAAAGTARRQAH
jgi:hypothetical protein